jgi:ABC-type lipoprotein release transport system permease subunit
MKIPILYNLRSMRARPVSTALTALGIALVVAVFIGTLALANGFATALVRTGSPTTVLVLRKGADSELSSSINRETASILASMPQAARGTDGRALVSAEVYVVIAAGRIGDTTAMANVVVRGVGPEAWQVRSNVRVAEGRLPASGRNEICLGTKLVGRFPNTGIGQSMHFAGRPWEVVCHFTAGGSAFESEVWGGNEQIMPAMRGEVFQSVSFRLADPAAFEDAKRALEADKRLTVDVHRESEFYAQQSQLLGNILRILAILVTSIMAVGAIFGAVNTMYAAVASRRPEIAVLLTLGFRPGNVLVSFLLESALVATIGGIVGCLLALPLNGLVTSTTNWASFSEIAFAFRITPGLLLAGMAFAVVMGTLGGYFPARQASKIEVVKALR